MSDFLAEGKPFRKLADLLNLPVPKPPRLLRATGPWQPVLPQEGNLIYDASPIATVGQLKEMYAYLHERLKSVKKNGRIILLNSFERTGSIEKYTAQQAVEGFMRSVAKEVGRKGIAVNLIRMEGSAADLKPLVDPLIQFLQSAHSAYITGQVIRVAPSTNTPEALYVRPLAGKTALVTGGARGIGESIARRMAEEGAKVMVLDREAELELLKSVASQIGGEAVALDITDNNAPLLIKEKAQQLGGLDIIVHNAGITRDKTLAKMEAQQWDTVLNVNLQAAIRITEALLPELVRDNGRIICMSSISGISGNFGQTNYAASKAGLIGFVKAIVESGPGKGITANAIAPGFIETKMTAKMPFFTREAARRLNNLSQAGLPIDIAEAAVFLASPGAAGINGQTLRVCGGAMMGA
ncbi:MAG: 3-oxoacyl-ACP reductase [Chitinophagales bacterium]|nr:3-oxoacyl-ACP reductase [Chitinophagales bacterium]